MKTLLSMVLMVVGFSYLALAQTSAPTPPPAVTAPAAPSVQAGLQAVAQAAATAALQTVVQQAQAQQAAPIVQQTLTSSGPVMATIAAMFGAFGLILSGVQQLLGLGARSNSPSLSKYSSKALAVVQHVAGAPDVSTKGS